MVTPANVNVYFDNGLKWSDRIILLGIVLLRDQIEFSWNLADLLERYLYVVKQFRKYKSQAFSTKA